MNIRGYFRALRNRWRIVLLLLVLSVAAGTAITVTTTKEYQATAQIFVSIATADDPSQLAQGNTFTQARVQSYTSVATSPTVTEAVVDELGLKATPDQLAEKISADAPLNKVLINIHVSDGSPTEAARLANAVAIRFSTVVEGLEQTTPTATSPVKLTVTQPAKVPGFPIAPRTKLNIALAILIGLILGVGGAVLREVLDNTIKAPDELYDQSGVPVLGVVPWDKRAPGTAIAFRADAHGSRAEAFRQLRTNLQFVDIDNPPRIIAVTSALPAEGKTLTALNLAAALAEAGQRVCLVEADLRKPTLARVLGLVADIGLTTTLIGKAPVEQVMQSAGPNLAVLTSGPIPPNPSELLVSTQFRNTIQHIASQVDVVVIDTAPLLPVADGAEVASLADATLLAVRANKTTRDQIKRAKETLANVGVSPVGAILSMARAGQSGGYNYYYYSEYRPNRTRHSVAPATTGTAPEKVR
jgi:capsular exopolysaccharide synthesis family protein